MGVIFSSCIKNIMILLWKSLQKWKKHNRIYDCIIGHGLDNLHKHEGPINTESYVPLGLHHKGQKSAKTSHAELHAMEQPKVAP